MTDVVIVAAGRTAIGKFGGALAKISAADLVTLLYEMAGRDAKRGLASLCIGGGMGVALAVERP